MSAGAEAGWWAEARAGDGEAFGRMFDEHRDRVYRHALRLTDTVPDAEDVTAAAFLELWRRRDDVRVVNGSVLAWLLVTTSNVARNQRRSTLRYRRLLASLPRADDAPDPADVLDGISPDLVAALRLLSPRDLNLVTLVVIEGFSLAEAASVLDLTPGAAKTRLHRARERVRSAMASFTAPVPGGAS